MIESKIYAQFRDFGETHQKSKVHAHALPF